MATFTITNRPTYFDNITIKNFSGGDTYNINGGQLIIDCDTRWRIASYSPSGALGSMTISTTLGGDILVDGTRIRQLKYNTGSGTVPVPGTTISSGSATGTFIGVWNLTANAPTGSPVASGSAMPTRGLIKFKNESATTFTINNVLTGINATAASASEVGFMEVTGVESKLVTVPRLGTFTVTGAWYDLGYTNGSSNQRIQLPMNQINTYYAGVWIERDVGANNFEFYPNVGSATTFGTDEDRAEVCWITSTSQLILGNSGAATNGYTPVAGLKIRIPNIVFTNTTITVPEANVLPNSTLSTRPTFLTTSAGAININNCTMGWYPTFIQPYSVIIKDSAIFEQIQLQEVASKVVLKNVGIGQSAANAQNALLVTSCFAGADIQDCVFTRATAGTSSYICSLTNILDFTFINNRYTTAVKRSGATFGSMLITNGVNTKHIGEVYSVGGVYLTTCNNHSISGCTYIDVVHEQWTNINPQYAYTLQTKCNNVTIDDIRINNSAVSSAPYSGVVNISQCDNVFIKNMGTPINPINMNSPTTSATACLVNFGGNSSNITIKRLYATGLRTGLFITGTNNTDTGITVENVWSTTQNKLAGIGGVGWQSLNAIYKGMYMDARPFGATENTMIQNSFTSVYGNIFYDGYINNTQGRMGIFFNEQDILQSYTVSAGTPRFTSTGSLLLTNKGDSLIYETPYYVLGYTGFHNTPISAAGTNVTGTAQGGNMGAHNVRWDIDKNDGLGYTGTWSNTNTISTITGVTPSAGFKMKLLVECVSANTANALNGLFITTTASTVSQQYQYPLATIPASLVLTGLPVSAEIRVYDTNTMQMLAGVDNILEGDNGIFTYNYTWSGVNTTVFIVVFALGYIAQRYENQVLGSSGLTIPVVLFQDRQYYNPA